MPKPPSPPQFANARPRKHFFLEMFTRDISLEDCILDLIDNSIDGLIKSRGIDISSSLLSNGERVPAKGTLPAISLSYTDQKFELDDQCGGIPFDDAVKEVFNFGHAAGVVGGSLGVYGIGLKRAIFKIGESFEMHSRTTKDGFDVDLDVKKWAEEDETLDDWRIPITPVAGVSSLESAGTRIVIQRLRAEVAMRVNDGGLEQRLRSVIAQTYGLFLDRFVRIQVNQSFVEPFHIPIGRSDEVQPAYDEFTDDEVTVKLFASLAARDANNEWRGDVAGWYALCNGRIVVAADKSDLTGWGSGPLPQFHSSKFRGFIGVAFFQSANPLALPWTTTKRGLNRESPVYLRARNRMRGVARPIITFLDGLYKSDGVEEAASRAIADSIVQTDLANIAKKPQSQFTVTPRRRSTAGSTVSIQFDAERAAVDRVRDHLKKFRWGAGKVGEYTFKHYLKTECPE